MEEKQTIKISPQEGPQEQFLSTTADIAIYGGAAGGGKSFAILLEPIRHHANRKFGCVIFRRNTVQVRNEGGLWDESENIYRQLGWHGREGILEWVAPSGMRVKFAHLEHDKTVYDWQGSQIPFIGFDELTHFTEKQFWYMLSRNRSTSGVPGYVRATTNPDADSWVRKLIDWWIGPDGYPIKERSGVVRWFIRQDDKLIWGDSREDFSKEDNPKSFTFIASTLQDNKILMDKDPAYLANLKAMARVERLRLLGGNWDVRRSAGMIFRKEWFEVVSTIPAGWNKVIRYWDKAATEPSETSPNPDYTVGLKLYGYPDGRVLVADVRRDRVTPLKVERMVRNTAEHDGVIATVCIEQEPGSSGVADADNYVRLLRGFDVRVCRPSVDKVTRALPVSAQAEHGNVMVLQAPWNEDFFKECENFPPETSAGKDPSDESAGHDDQVDGLSGAYNEMFGNPSLLDVL